MDSTLDPAMTADTPTIFFSYGRADAEFALKLAKDLRSAGISLWIDQLDIPVGDRWDVAVGNALKALPSLLLVLSPASVESQNVMDEVAFALESNKKIVPVLHRRCDIPFRIRRLQYIDFTATYDGGFTQLLRTLKAPQVEGNLPGPPGTATGGTTNWRFRLAALMFLALLATLGIVTIYNRNPISQDGWKRSQAGQVLPNNILEGGWEHTEQGGKRPLYICRSEYYGGINPGKLLGADCYIPFGGGESGRQTYEVLVMSHVHWVPATSDSLPSGAVIGGREPNASPLYICRAEKSTAEGRIQGIHPGKLSDGVCYIGFGGREEQHSRYEVLVKDSN
jgi:hypothetical protein